MRPQAFSVNLFEKHFSLIGRNYIFFAYTHLRAPLFHSYTVAKKINVRVAQKYVLAQKENL